MNALARNLGLLALASMVGAAVAACGEDGQTIGAGQCNSTNSLPLYTWLYDGSTKEWTRVGPGNKPVDTTNITQAEQGPSGGSGRCITPPGTALTLGTGGSTGGGKDAGKD